MHDVHASGRPPRDSIDASVDEYDGAECRGCWSREHGARTTLQLSRVILMSAHLTPEIAKEALALGASRVMTKPIELGDVPALVHDVARPAQIN